MGSDRKKPEQDDPNWGEWAREALGSLNDERKAMKSVRLRIQRLKAELARLEAQAEARIERIKRTLLKDEGGQS